MNSGRGPDDVLGASRILISRESYDAGKDIYGGRGGIRGHAPGLKLATPTRDTKASLRWKFLGAKNEVPSEEPVCLFLHYFFFLVRAPIFFSLFFAIRGPVSCFFSSGLAKNLNGATGMLLSLSAWLRFSTIQL